MYKNLKHFFCCLILATLTSCSWIHHTEIIQGNTITPEMVNELHTGMTESEVKETMGTPVLMNIFTPSRMEYVYTYQLGRTHKEKRVVLLLNNGRVSEIYRR